MSTLSDLVLDIRFMFLSMYAFRDINFPKSQAEKERTDVVEFQLCLHWPKSSDDANRLPDMDKECGEVLRFFQQPALRDLGITIELVSDEVIQRETTYQFRDTPAYTPVRRYAVHLPQDLTPEQIDTVRDILLLARPENHAYMAMADEYCALLGLPPLVHTPSHVALGQHMYRRVLETTEHLLWELYDYGVDTQTHISPSAEKPHWFGATLDTALHDGGEALLTALRAMFGTSAVTFDPEERALMVSGAAVLEYYAQQALEAATHEPAKHALPAHIDDVLAEYRQRHIGNGSPLTLASRIPDGESQATGRQI